MARTRPTRDDNDAADRLIMDLISLGGAGVVVTDFSKASLDFQPGGVGVVAVGVHRAGPLPTRGLEGFDILLTSAAAPPRPWVGVPPGLLDATLNSLVERAERQPGAASAAAQVFRMTMSLPFAQALILESITYSMLLASGGFQAWRAANPPILRPDDALPRIVMEKGDSALQIRLNRPDARNAFDARMRDALVEALAFAVDDPEAPHVELSGEGPCFSAGGDLNEFGQADDPAIAHLIRTLRAPTERLHALGARATARLHGACIGAGIEFPAAAARVTASPGAWFRLPEVSMGLIPGAGGTASIPRRIGRHRACFMAISGADIDLKTALNWGLVDGVEAGE